MNRLRDLLLVSFIASLILEFTPVYAGSNAAETITQAEQDLKSATRAGAVWRLVDKATGSGAVGIDKLLELAKKKLDEGLSENEIYEFLIEKYGQWIAYDPEFNQKTFILWTLPILLFLVGGVILLKKIKLLK